jgi:hypothetical protein
LLRNDIKNYQPEETDFKWVGVRPVFYFPLTYIEQNLASGDEILPPGTKFDLQGRNLATRVEL